jgi:hypothetical protein
LCWRRTGKNYFAFLKLFVFDLCFVFCSEDAHLVNALYQELFAEKNFQLYVIVIPRETGELYRLIFRYTLDDQEIIKEMFNGVENKDFIQLAEDLPWLKHRNWYANPADEEEIDFSDLESVFGDNFCGGFVTTKGLEDGAAGEEVAKKN